MLVRDGQVLLCRPAPDKKEGGSGGGGGGYWYLPGGHVEFGEPAAVALAREFDEECTLKVRVLDAVQVDEHAFSTRKRAHHEINILFHVEPAAGMSEKAIRSVRSREPKIEFAWVDLAAVSDLAVVPASAKAYLMSGGESSADGSMTAATAGAQWVSDMGGAVQGK